MRAASTLDRARAAGVAAGGIGLALAAAWVAPALAVVVIWPLLYVVPGWVAFNWLRPSIAATARLGLAVVATVAVSTHLVWWLATIGGGYGRGTVFFAAAILALVLPAVAWRVGSLSPLITRGARALATARREADVVGLAAAVGLLVGGVLAVSLWREVPGGVASGGSNWSDLSVHLAIAQSVNAGNFPPDVPYFAGSPLVYHWFADFHAAIAARAAELFAVPSFLVGSAVLAGALVLLVHGLALTAFGSGPRARTAARYAAALAVLGGGMGWIRLVGDLANGEGDLLGLIGQHGYDNQWLTDWPFFFIPSVLGTGLLVHRATSYGLPLAIGAILLLVAAFPRADRQAEGQPDRPPLIVAAGVGGALLAPFHFFFFPAVPFLAAFWLITSRRSVADVARAAGWFALPYLLAIPFVVPPLTQAVGSGALKGVAGWEMAPFADGPAAVSFFYLTNLGIPLVLALVALTARPPWRAFLGIWLLGLFLVPNVVQFSGISFDMNKYFQLMWIAIGLLGGWLLSRWSGTARASVLAACLISPMLAAAWTATSTLGVLSTDQLAAAKWIAANTPERSVFVTDGWLWAPTDPAGRLRLLTFTPYIGNLGYDPSERVAQVRAIYCDGDPQAAADLMRQLDAAYVIDAPRPDRCDRPTDFAASPDFSPVYSNRTLTIYLLSSSP